MSHHRSLLTYAFAMIAFSAACSREPAKSDTKAIIGEDGRKIGASEQFLGTVGRFMTPFGACTAFLSGADEITTAAHCTPKLDELSVYRFILTQDKGIAKIVDQISHKR